MKIIAVMNEKGGTGKSTLSTNIATALFRRGFKVVLVDADPQATARDWREGSPDGIKLPPVIALDRPKMLNSIQTLDADYVVIDGPAKADEMPAAIVRIADIALVVIQPSGADIWASATTVKLIRSKIDVGGKIDAAFLVNRVNSSANLSKLVTTGEWNEYEIPQLASTVGNRVSFAQALTDGKSIYDLADAQAKTEIDQIINEMENAKWL